MENVFLMTLFRHKAWCNEGLVAALKAASDDIDRMKMALVLFTLGHTATVDLIFKAHLTGTAHEFRSSVPTQLPNLDQLGAIMRDTDAWYIDYAGRTSPSELQTQIAFTYADDGAPGRMTRGEMLAHIITHGASHRGAIGRILDDMKVKGAPDMVTTFRRVTTF